MTRRLSTLATGLATLLLVACNEGSDTTSLTTSSLTDLATGSSSIGGNLVDEDSLPAANGKITIYLVSALPPDTLPPDSTPPDSTPPDTTPLPPDSTGLTVASVDLPGGMFLGDTIPGDSTPPPPPAAECGKRGRKLAHTRADENGIFQVDGLPPGVYDIEAKDQGDTGAICGVMVRDNQAVFVTIMLGE